MFYLIGLGMNKGSITAEALKVLDTCDKVYLEGYTVDFPYDIKELEKGLGTNIEVLERKSVEDESILKDALDSNIALLVYGDSLSATTHTQLILSCKKQNIPFRIFHNASILTTVAETGLSLYKFGKTASMPNWKEHTNKPTSFISYIKENLSIKAHTLLLTDIGLQFKDSLEQLKIAAKKEGLSLQKKIIAVSNAGTEEQKIFYDSTENLINVNVEMPFCLIIPGEISFFEEDFLKSLTTSA